MEVVNITKNATLQKDGDGLFWLLIELSAGRATDGYLYLTSNELHRMARYHN